MVDDSVNILAYQTPIINRRIIALPGEWVEMDVSQITQNANSACTTIALHTLETILCNPEKFNFDHSFQDSMKEVQNIQKGMHKILRINYLSKFSKILT